VTNELQPQQADRLSADERIDLASSTRVILDGLTKIRDAGEEVGAELLKVQQDSRRLYREYGTFDDWIFHTLAMSKRNAYGLIRLAKVTANLADLCNMFHKALTRRQAEMLGRVPKEMQRLAYKIASAAGPATDDKVKAAIQLVKDLETGDPDALATAQSINEALAAGSGEEPKTRKHRTFVEWCQAKAAEFRKKFCRPTVQRQVPAIAAAEFVLDEIDVLIEMDPAGVTLAVLARLQTKVPEHLSPIVAERARRVLEEAIGHGA
jgi:hypothetical protein